jgi:hypothetical protein
MERDANARKVFRVAPLCAVVLLAFGSSAAVADESAASNDGLLKFANVRVVNAAAPVASTVSSTQAGMRTFKDSVTGELRGPTAEEMQAVAAETPAARTRGMYQFTSSSHGGIGATLDESFMQYSVVARQADGSMSEVCVTGADKAAEIVANPELIKAAPKEALNVR